MTLKVDLLPTAIIITAILLILKISGAVEMEWLIVFLPLIIVAAIILLVLLISAMALIITRKWVNGKDGSTD